MRICVIYSKGSSPKKSLKLVSSFIKGLEEQANTVDFFDISQKKDCNALLYDYIAIGSSNFPLFGKKVDPVLKSFLQQTSHLSGKRSFAFTTKRIFGVNKVLQAIMQKMEEQGMFVTFSEIFKDEISAKEIGKNLVG